jgi:hypothetical protein
MNIILAYKNFAANKNISHIGLGVAALNTAKSLIAAGIPALVVPITNAADLRARLTAAPATTHVIISAPWIPTMQMQALVNDFPHVDFTMVCHSNVGFLQADASGVALLRQAMEIEQSVHNFHVGGNSRRFCDWLGSAYAVPCAFLPNLYFLDGTTNSHRPLWTGGTLRIGAFGATRPLKNFMTAAGAAIDIARQLRGDLELWISTTRTEGGGETILNAVRAMIANVPHAKLVENGWQTWPQFRATVGHMHLTLQPSYTESFNMVAADSVAQGICCVTSDAITWVPEHWQADSDDTLAVSRIGQALLRSHTAAAEGLAALAAYNKAGMAVYRAFLG